MQLSPRLPPRAARPRRSGAATHQRAARPRRATRTAAGAPAAPQAQHELNVVITGGSKGLGFALAQQHLSAGDSVFICGRDARRLDAAVAALQQHAARQPRPGAVAGCVADMSQPGDVAQLQAAVAAAFGDAGVHRWLNNAGQVTRKRLLTQLEPDELVAVVNANVLGSLLGCRAAIALMQQQHERRQQQQPQQQGDPKGSHIFNFGFSRWGANASKTAVTHKATKMALTQLTRSLSEELAEAGLGFIGVHNLSPGMVLTDLLLQGAPPVARRFFNALAEEPETVAAELVPRIRAVQGTGTSIEYLNPLSAVARVVSGVPQIVNGGRFFDKTGARVPAPGAVYNEAGVREQF